MKYDLICGLEIPLSWISSRYPEEKLEFDPINSHKPPWNPHCSPSLNHYSPKLIHGNMLGTFQCHSQSTRGAKMAKYSEIGWFRGLSFQKYWDFEEVRSWYSDVFKAYLDGRSNKVKNDESRVGFSGFSPFGFINIEQSHHWHACMWLHMAAD